ncbi:MAG TPA: GNAT family N-acetyltransferase [Miltoncostaeaceae bacterium]|nr:GNAT family N-acetyltransferase [Miltoncostaeaceae bacterium]
MRPEPALHPALAPLARGDWDGLLDRVGNRDPLRRLAVLALTAPTVPSPVVACVWRRGRLAAAAPLMLGRERGLRVARTLGHPANWFDAEPPAETDAVEPLARALAGLGADVVTLAEVRPGSPLAAALGASVPVRVRRESPTYRVRTAEGGRMAGRRREAGRVLRRAERAGARVEVDTLAGWREVQWSLDAALDLHLRRWTDHEAGAGGYPPHELVATPEGRELVRRCIAHLGRGGALRLTRIVIDGRLAAFALAAVVGDHAVMYRTAHDRTSPHASGLGAAALVVSLGDLAAEGVAQVDLGAGGDAFKRQFTDPEPVVTLQAAVSRRGRLLLRAGSLRQVLRHRSGGGGPPA